MIQCPHCGEITKVERMASQRKYRNEFGLDVFECPDCHKNYKIDPREYLLAQENMNQGSVPDSITINGAKVDTILPSEKAAIDYDRRPRAPWRGPARVIVIIVCLILAYAILG